MDRRHTPRAVLDREEDVVAIAATADGAEGQP
jgi:hypothetical protein